MPLNRYRVLSKIAETGNMRKAAKEMMYTQQAISRIVKCMESEFGFELFHRERDGVSLTEEAIELLPTIEELVKNEDHLMSVVSEIQAEKGIVKQANVGACGSIVMGVMNKVLASLREEHPELTVSVLYDANDNNTVNNLKSGKIDCALMVDGCQEDMDYEPLFREPFVAALPKNHPLVNKEVISMEDLKKYHNVITSDNPYYDEIINNANHNTEVVDEEIMMIPIISSGNAVGIMSGLFQYEIYRDVVIKPLKENHDRVIGIATKPEKKITPSAKIFIETLKDVVGENYELLI